jgi:hypothetical protein
MGPGNEVEVVGLQEILDDLGREHEGDAPLGRVPPVRGLVGVRPQQVAEQACVGHVGGPDDLVDLLDPL